MWQWWTSLQPCFWGRLFEDAPFISHHDYITCYQSTGIMFQMNVFGVFHNFCLLPLSKPRVVWPICTYSWKSMTSAGYITFEIIIIPFSLEQMSNRITTFWLIYLTQHHRVSLVWLLYSMQLHAVRYTYLFEAWKKGTLVSDHYLVFTDTLPIPMTIPPQSIALLGWCMLGQHLQPWSAHKEESIQHLSIPYWMC